MSNQKNVTWGPFGFPMTEAAQAEWQRTSAAALWTATMEVDEEASTPVYPSSPEPEKMPVLERQPGVDYSLLKKEDLPVPPPKYQEQKHSDNDALSNSRSMFDRFVNKHLVTGGSIVTFLRWDKWTDNLNDINNEK